jgi:tetratricopeptide (TPR) repeat protein
MGPFRARASLISGTGLSGGARRDLLRGKNSAKIPPLQNPPMRRTLVILLFIAGISFAPLPVRAQTDASSEQFVEFFLGVKKAEEQEKAGDTRAALAMYRAALATLTKIKQENPKWQADLIDHRIKTTSESIARVQGKAGGAAMVGGGAMTPGANDPGVLPLLDPEDPLSPKATAALPPPPKGKKPKYAPLIDESDPLAGVKQRLASLESQLNDANERLREEQERNAKITKDMSDAIDAKAKAEDARKKAMNLSEVYQKSFLDLKGKGDANVERVKELEAKWAEAKKTAQDTQANLDAAEERISQLLGRSRVMQAKAAEAGTLPAQVKALQAKLDAEQKATAQQADGAKKREEDLKSQIAALNKERKDSGTMPAELKALQAKLDAELQMAASEAAKAKKREDDLKGQLSELTKERNDAREELVRLKELNKHTDKLMADNAGLLKKLGDYEKQIFDFKSNAASRDTELATLRKKVTETQNALTSSDERNITLQAEIAELQKRVGDYSKQIAQFKADKTASLEERQRMESENKLLQGIVMRVLQEDANRSQRKKMIQSEISKLHIQSDALLKQINYLTEPTIKLTNAERKLFKKPKFDVEDPNTLVFVMPAQSGAETPATTTTEPAKPATETPELPPLPKPPETTGVTPPDAAKPPVETVKGELPAPPVLKSKLGDDLPVKESTETKRPEVGATPAVTSTSGAKLPADVKPLAEQAKQAFEREKFPDSEKLYDKALQQAPNNVYLLSNRAVVQFRMGKFKQAEESFKKALAIAPEDAFCWSTIGIVYYSEEKYDDAVNALTKSLAINPRNPTAHNYLGITAAQKGWLEAAQKELESAIQLDPKYADAWFNLAVTHTLKTPPDKEEAGKAYKKAIELGAEHDPAMEALITSAGASINK